jgi:hypothetical protein
MPDRVEILGEIVCYVILRFNSDVFIAGFGKGRAEIEVFYVDGKPFVVVGDR